MDITGEVMSVGVLGVRKNFSGVEKFLLLGEKERSNIFCVSNKNFLKI